MTRTVRIGTRASALARWQAEWVRDALVAATPGLRAELVEVRTRGDADRRTPIAELGEVGVFTHALERALRAGEIDLAVHSLKDLPIDDSDQLTVPALCCREDPRDVLVAPAGTRLATLPPNARVGTSSLRRRAQMLAARRDVVPVPVRGNVETRVRLAWSGALHGVVLAAAGLHRLGMGSSIAEYFPVERVVPAPGQGALAVQCRARDSALVAAIRRLDEPAVRAAVTAERAFLRGVGGGCSAPVGASAVATDALTLLGIVADADGRHVIRVRGEGSLEDAARVGRDAAERALAGGAADLLA